MNWKLSESMPTESTEPADDMSEGEEGGASFGAGTSMGSRRFLAEHCLRNTRHNKGESRYAIKLLSPEVKEDVGHYHMQGVMDLALEVRFLSDMMHPNIVKLRAVSTGDVLSDDFFLVMDRLYDTLETRIYKVWKPKQDRQKLSLTSLLGKLLCFGGKSKEEGEAELIQDTCLLEERLIYAYDLSSAVSYLHRRKIIYRDLVRTYNRDPKSWTADQTVVCLPL